LLLLTLLMQHWQLISFQLLPLDHQQLASLMIDSMMLLMMTLVSWHVVVVWRLLLVKRV
jgi:hypothetical protein